MSARTETVQGNVGSFTWSTYYTAGFAYNTFAGQRRIDANTQARHAVARLEWNDEVTVVVNNHARMVSQTRGRCKQTCPKPFPMDGAVVNARTLSSSSACPWRGRVSAKSTFSHCSPRSHRFDTWASRPHCRQRRQGQACLEGTSTATQVFLLPSIHNFYRLSFQLARSVSPLHNIYIHSARSHSKQLRYPPGHRDSISPPSWTCSARLSHGNFVWFL